MKSDGCPGGGTSHEVEDVPEKSFTYEERIWRWFKLNSLLL